MLSNKIQHIEEYISMNKTEIKTIMLLAGIYVARMLGLFIIFPSFSLLANDLAYSTPAKIGFALGAYSLAQAILQVPAGWLSDIIGRKKVLYGGLILFFIGSVMAACVNDINWLIAARILQGMGAISAVCLAYVGDSIRGQEQGKAMMIIGISIGTSFMLAFIFGTIISEHWGLSGLFVTTAILALVALVFAYFLPNAPQKTTTFNVVEFKQTLVNTKLISVNIQVAILHLTLSAVFFLLPIMVSQYFPNSSKAWLYVLPLLITIFIVGPFVRNRDKGTAKLPLFWLLFMLVVVSLAILPVFYKSIYFVTIMTAFFATFTLIETLLPAQLLKFAKESTRGATSGIFSLYQLIGSFLGGILGSQCYTLFEQGETLQQSFYVLAIPALFLIIGNTFTRKKS